MEGWRLGDGINSAAPAKFPKGHRQRQRDWALRESQYLSVPRVGSLSVYLICRLLLFAGLPL